jgi:hypothetical protein
MTDSTEERRNTNLAPMTSEFYPIMEQVRLGLRIKIPCRESLTKRSAPLSCEVKC